LIGDADAANFAGIQCSFFQCDTATRQRSVPNLRGVMFDPTISREMLFEFLLSQTQWFAIGVEDYGSTTRGALIDRENIATHSAQCSALTLVSEACWPSLHAASILINSNQNKAAMLH